VTGRATGIGGVFIRASDPDALKRWYVERLGLPAEGGPIVFRWRERDADGEGLTVFGIFPEDTDYFGSRRQAAMINFRVEDLDGLLADLRDAGVELAAGIEEHDNGRFAWIVDPEGNRVELWEPSRARP
jgi:predicted enzyme related to lactoylglutathione lyase